jgi:hypothetical protein
VPKLIAGLNDSDAWTRVSAAHALGMFGADAGAAIAPLSGLTNANVQASGFIGPDVSIEARNALRKIRPQVENFPGFEFPTADTGL